MIQMRALLDKTSHHGLPYICRGNFGSLCLFSNSICTAVDDRSQRHAKCMPECPREC